MMNIVKQLGLGFVLLIIVSGGQAKSTQPSELIDGPSYESSMLPGSKLVAGGEGEFFIVGAAEPAAPPKNKIIEQPVEQMAMKEAIKPEVVYPVKQLALKVSKRKPVVVEVKSVMASNDPADRKINRLFALHHAIGAAAQKPQRVLAQVKVVKPVKSVERMHYAALKSARSVHGVKLKV
ncbi:MAG: hypothetical protein WAW86_01530 [Gammaproteobacteria bacterium]